MKILYVTTISNTVNAFLIPHIEMFVGEGHQVDVAFKTEQEINPKILELGCNVFEVCFSRLPIDRCNYKAFHLLKKVILDGKYDVVHTHTPVASAITRLVCKTIPNVKVIYTAHGFHFYSGASFINWLIYYPIEKYLSKYTDVLITINKEDYNRAKSSFKAKRTEYVPGVGIDIEKFQNVSIDRVQKRKKIGVPEDAFVLLSVGELNKNKNHEVVIKALKELHDNRIHYVICGEGILQDKLKKLCQKVGLSERVHFLGYRVDVGELCKIVDVFVFPSLREGLPVSLIEAMSVGLPIIGSHIRGNVDLITENEGGYLFDPHKYSEIAKCIMELFQHPYKMKEMGDINIQLSKQYDIININLILADLYKRLY